MPPTSSAAGPMFHTFQGMAPARPNSETQDPPKTNTGPSSKRITTPHACAECKRRKIRCDGRQPCTQCIGCRSPKPCYYDKHRQRVIPSRKTLDALQQSLDECRSILKKLFPSEEVQTLLPLSRPDLVALLDKPSSLAPAIKSPQTNISPQSNSFTEYRSPALTTSPDEGSLANLEQIPSRDTEWDEERRNRDPIPAESDDVNGLSLSVDRQSSYLGASSIKAAFIVMLQVAPALRPYLESSTVDRGLHEKSGYPTPRPGYNSRGYQRVPWSSEGQTLIDAYFNRVQIFVPMLDEPSFRANYLAGQRTDAPWLALLNMVFAMGSVVAMKSDDHNHLMFYNRSKEHLSIDSFGSGNLETLQALALMGGYYLHYINRPNMANAITGAALRMATALGLHRESLVAEANNVEANSLETDLRRRTWWSLFCLDTWASTTMGRPSMGRWGEAITIRPPETAGDHSESSTTGQHIRIVPLIENIKFCKIATEIQDALAISPLPSHEHRNALDTKLVTWSENLPWILRSSDPCPEALSTARSVMKWRYQNLRIVLHRPVLLNLAYRGTAVLPGSEELLVVDKCRAIAAQTISDITRESARNQMSGWNAVWFLYQASMIPLVSIFWETWNTAKVKEWQGQIEMVLEGLEAMADWSLAARRSREVVAKMYEASKGPITRQGSPKLLPDGNLQLSNGNLVQTGGGHPQQYDSNGHYGPRQMVGMEQDIVLGNNMVIENQSIWDLDGMNWGDLPDLDMPFDPADLDYDLNMNWDGSY